MEVLEAMSKDVDNLRKENEYLNDTFGFLRSVISDYKDNPALGFQTLSTLLGDRKLKSRVEEWIEENNYRKEEKKDVQKKEQNSSRSRKSLA